MKALLAVVMLLLAACTGASGEQCTAFGAACVDGGNLVQCCTGTNCRYIASDGTVFPCDGTLCQSAVQMVRDWCLTH